MSDGIMRGMTGQRIEIIGWASKDAMTFGEGDNIVVKFSVPTPANYKQGEDELTMWYNVVCFQRTAKYLQDVKKGNYLKLVGFMKKNELTNKEGELVKGQDFIVNDASFLESRKDKQPREEGGPNSDHW